MPWQEQEQTALKGWLLDRIETTLKVGAGGTAAEPALTTSNKLADRLRADTDFLQVAELYAGRSDFDVNALVADLITGEAVPLLPVQRYSEAGLRKRAEWERTWALPRKEDAIDAETTDEAKRKRRKAADVGAIPVPPKYKKDDFRKDDFWRMRGGLDVPKERFVSSPQCSRDADGSLVIAWAGLNPLQLATAIASYYLDLKDNEGWEAERLKPLLGGIHELVPWIKQCMVLDRPEGRPVSPELLAAAVRLEKFTGGVPVPVREGLRLHAAAVQVTGSMDTSTLMPILGSKTGFPLPRTPAIGRTETSSLSKRRNLIALCATLPR